MSRTLTSENWQNQLELLIDGELESGQLQEFLQQCETDPVRWKKCALAFVEAQQFKLAFNGLLTAPISHREYKNTSVSVLPQKSVKTFQKSNFLNHTLVGMFLISSFAFGWLMSSWNQPMQFTLNNEVKNTNPVEQSVSTNPREQEQEKINTPQFVSLVSRSADGVYEQRMNLPVKETTVEEWQKISSQYSKVPDYILQQYAEQGYIVQSQPYLYKAGELDDGRPLIIPVTSYQVKPKPVSYYQ